MSCLFEDILRDHVNPSCGAYERIRAAHNVCVSQARDNLLSIVSAKELELKKERAALDVYRAELEGFHHFRELLKCLRQSEPQS